MLRHLRFLSFPITLVILLMVTLPALAQYGASVQGTITDPSGAVVSGAKVTVTDTATGKSSDTTTSPSGFYRITGLPPGKYKVTIEAPSFRTEIVNDVNVKAESLTGRDVKLTVGAASENVTVTAAPDKLQTENANITGNITETQIRELPSFGRDPYELLKLAPGIFGDNSRSGSGNVSNLPNSAGPGGSNSSIFQVENQVPISANGQRVSANNYEVDGVSVNSLQWGGAAIITPNEESVQEVKVSSTSYSAEDGRNSGAQINVISKTGTNLWHGSALFRYGDPGLNAFNKYGSNFGTGSKDRVNRRLRDFGGSIGGPIIHDKLFFFFSYEANKNHDLQTSARYVETPAFISLLQAGRAGGIGTTILTNPLAMPRILSILTPSCADISVPCAVVPLAGGGTGLDVGSLTGTLGTPACLFCSGGGPLDGVADLQLAEIGTPFTQFGQQFNARVDLNLGKNTFAVSTYVSQRNDTNGDVGADARPMADIVFTPLNLGITLLWSRVISVTALNEVRLNASRWAFNTVQSSSSTNWGIPRVEIQDLLINGFDRVRYGADRAETTPAAFAQNNYELRDTFSKVWGSHATKWGVEHRWEQDNNNLLGGARPLYTFQGLWNFANDAPIFELINADPTTGGPASAQRYFRSRDLALFAQDDWKVFPNLTVNLGLRWEYFAPLSEAHGRASNLILDPDLMHSRFVVTDRLSKPDRDNFAPRLGFAWAPSFANNKFVVRGGIGVAFNRIPDVLFANTRGNPPFFARFGLCCYAGSGILYAL
ncbi:MAG: TonB-dependent receptor, partial [Acidobacteriota bacterium]|nr:TonB-dependent receptor [Acidobacteriota bacterium]